MHSIERPASWCFTYAFSWFRGHNLAASLSVERSEAEAIYDQGREVVAGSCWVWMSRSGGLSSGLRARTRGSQESSGCFAKQPRTSLEAFDRMHLSREKKSPRSALVARFEFQRFSKQPDMSLAQSLFSHLNEADILLCLRQLALIAPAHHRFFATYFDGRSTENKRRSNSHQTFRYEASQLADIAAQAGWDAENIGDWGHPRGQQMICFTPAR